MGWLQAKVKAAKAASTGSNNNRINNDVNVITNNQANWAWVKHTHRATQTTSSKKEKPDGGDGDDNVRTPPETQTDAEQQQVARPSEDSPENINYNHSISLPLLKTIGYIYHSIQCLFAYAHIPIAPTEQRRGEEGRVEQNAQHQTCALSPPYV